MLFLSAVWVLLGGVPSFWDFNDLLTWYDRPSCSLFASFAPVLCPCDSETVSHADAITSAVDSGDSKFVLHADATDSPFIGLRNSRFSILTLFPGSIVQGPSFFAITFKYFDFVSLRQLCFVVFVVRRTCSFVFLCLAVFPDDVPVFDNLLVVLICSGAF